MPTRRSPAAAADALAALLAGIEQRPDVDGAAAVHPAHRAGAANLADYLALRRHDLRDLQGDLSRLGVSSLARGEAHVRATVGAALGACAALAGRPRPDVDTSGFESGPAALAGHAAALLGPPPFAQPVRIMVTLPSSAADDDGALVGELVAAGMDCARVNTAHDDPAAWRRMIDAVRAAAKEAGRPCTVLADLAGPKLRTGPLAAGPRVVRVKPPKDGLGRVVRPATLILVPEGVAPPATDAVVVPVTGDLLDGVREDDEVVVDDTRGRRRRLVVRAVSPGAVTVDVARTTWLATGTRLERRSTRKRAGACGVVGDLPQRGAALRLAIGDRLVLSSDLTPATPPGPGEVARIGCTLPEAVAALQPGDRVELDDGAIGGEVVGTGDGEVVVAITRARASGAALRAEKGINLPDTEVDVPALAPADLAALDAIGADVDVVGLSFVRHADDVAALHAALAERELDVGVVVKIETPGAFRELPAILVAAMAAERAGVMIARGDLAVEAGFERTAELQEEILWACEAAHLPAIWATQVLETLAKEGQPSRAEVTDAAMATRAECVMLNKGPHVERAVRTLADILTRMAGHQRKKTWLLRELRSW